MKTILITLLMFFSIDSITAQNEMIVRLTEIEIDSNFVKEYSEILKEESSASVALEPGVISIFPMFQKDNPIQIRILEIYANKEAYESHLKTPHFQKYKTTTLKMVKALRLIDMSVMDPENMKEMFSKL
ncbi:putative quinol monooxygenase [Flavobacterium sp.]|uniref:putative quinol monooxygenase n=1 Tax=Flavobacterium sp. TaxID=239 RepID=UPI002C3AA5D1|nr:antibiotic biosynthesis monooxygenase [Flavobacterium sp.]HSD05628.1 antibiotic biosynthesis monooxygenase [Flavobacterium sp.]